MGCILACLRLNNDKNKKRKKKDSLKSSPVPSKSKEPLLPKYLFGSVFESQGSPCEQVVDVNSQDCVDEEIWDREIEVEAKYLKSCGAILETPAEFRKASEKLTAGSLNNEAKPSTSSHLTKKFVWDEQLEESNFAETDSSSFNFKEHQSQGHIDSVFSSEVAVLDVSLSQNDIQTQPTDSKGSACFRSVENDTGTKSLTEFVVLDVSPVQNSQIQPLGSESFVCLGSRVESVGLDVSSSQDDNQTQPLGSKYSPFATPLKLTDEMETPGTIFPVSQGSTRRKNTRVRTQYVYPIQQLDQSNKTQQSLVTSSALMNHNDKRSLHRKDFDKENHSSVKRLRSGTPPPFSLSQENSQLVTSLSGWLKFPPGKNERSESEINALKNYCPTRTPDVERPIFGISMPWNENDASQVSPKWWGGNGIPNTTTKYKEDQKVSWHATPFEERLNKALSNEKLFPQRKDISRDLVELEVEGDGN